jgi:hypothetical protein
MTTVRVKGEYGFLTVEGIRQLLVDGGAVTVPDGVKYLGLTYGAEHHIADLLDNEKWCDYQRIKRQIWKEVKEESAS